VEAKAGLEVTKKWNNNVYRNSQIAQQMQEDTTAKFEDFQKQFLELTNKHQYPLDAIGKMRLTFALIIPQI